MTEHCVRTSGSTGPSCSPCPQPGTCACACMHEHGSIWFRKHSGNVCLITAQLQVYALRSQRCTPTDRSSCEENHECAHVHLQLIGECTCGDLHPGRRCRCKRLEPKDSRETCVVDSFCAHRISRRRAFHVHVLVMHVITRVLHMYILFVVCASVQNMCAYYELHTAYSIQSSASAQLKV
jgi:hypothetical protein